MDDDSLIHKHLFRFDDEIGFKRQYVIQFLASLGAVNYQGNGSRGRNTVEDAKRLADMAWQAWQDSIGLVPER